MKTSRKETNVYAEITLLACFEEFEREDGPLRVIDVAAGQQHTLVLTQPNKYEPLQADYEHR